MKVFKILLNPEGRMRRKPYIITIVSISIAGILISSLVGNSSSINNVLAVLFYVLMICPEIKRTRDIGYGAWYSVPLLILFNILYMIFIMFFSSKRSE